MKINSDDKNKATSKLPRVPLGEPLDDDLDALCTPEAIAARAEGAEQWWQTNAPGDVTKGGETYDLRGAIEAELDE